MTFNGDFLYEELHLFHSLVLSASDGSIKDGLTNFFSYQDFNLDSNKIGQSKYYISNLPDVLIFQIQRTIFVNGQVVKDTPNFMISKVLQIKLNYRKSEVYNLHSIFNASRRY